MKGYNRNESAVPVAQCDRCGTYDDLYHLSPVVYLGNEEQWCDDCLDVLDTNRILDAIA